MAHPKERREQALKVLREQFKGDVYKCAKFIGIDRKTLDSWQKQDQKKETEIIESELPAYKDVREDTLKRIYAMLKEEHDPKKMTETLILLDKFFSAPPDKKDFFTELSELSEQQKP